MSDLISREDAINSVRWGDTYPQVIDRIKALPSADTDMSEYSDRLWKTAYERGKAEAEPRTGEWMPKEHLWECDQCGCRINRAKPLKGNIWNYNFCPNCGADMRGE